VSPDPASYRLTTGVRRDVSYSQYASRQLVTWTFHSQPGDQALPLLVARYGARLDAYGRTPAGRPCPLTVGLEATPGSPKPVAGSVGLRVSYDDGATWHAVRVAEGRATFTPSASARFVSLRATGRDQAGNTVDQTVIRAFGVK